MEIGKRTILKPDSINLYTQMGIKKGRRGEYIQTLDWLQPPLAEMEIRAFDYSLFEIYGNDIEALIDTGYGFFVFLDSFFL